MTEEELKNIKRKAFREGVSSVWNDIAKVTPRLGDYNCLYNAIHGTEKFPNGFDVTINAIHEN